MAISIRASRASQPARCQNSGSRPGIPGWFFPRGTEMEGFLMGENHPEMVKIIGTYSN